MKLDDLIFTGKGFFAFNMKILFYVGLWPEDVPKRHLLMYKAYELILHVTPFAFIILTAIGTYEHRHDMVVLLSNLDKTLVAYNFVLKTFFFVFKRKDLNILITEIKYSGDNISEKQERLMAFHVIVVTVLSTATVGAFSLLSQLKGELPVEAWIPFNETKNQINLFLGLQILAISFMVCLLRNYAIQGIVCSVVMYFCDQLIELQNRIRNLKFSKEDEAREEFRNIVQKHVRLMRSWFTCLSLVFFINIFIAIVFYRCRYSRSFTNIFKEFFLIQNLAVTIELCLNAIMVSVVGMTEKTLFASFLSYLCLALLNAYIFCYLGNELIIQSEGVSLAAYESEWTSWPIDMQRNLLIIIRIAQKPLSLSAGGMATMCIQTYSQCTLLGIGAQRVGLYLEFLQQAQTVLFAALFLIPPSYMNVLCEFACYVMADCEIFLRIRTSALYNAYSIFAVLNDMVE